MGEIGQLPFTLLGLYRHFTINYDRVCLSTVYAVNSLDVLSNYFEFQVISMCNIPEIHLAGTLADWQSFAKRVDQLATSLDLSWWLDHVRPLVGKIFATVQGELDLDFWKSIYKLNNMSGGPFINGWIVNFFPFVKANARGLESQIKHDYSDWDIVKIQQRPHSLWRRIHARNPYLGRNQEAQNITTDRFHQGLARVPLHWQSLTTLHKMELLGGPRNILPGRATISHASHWLAGAQSK